MVGFPIAMLVYRRVGGFNYLFFKIFTPKIGEDETILTNIFQLGWNHQLELIFGQKFDEMPLK